MRVKTGMPLILDFALFKVFETQPPPPQDAIAFEVVSARVCASITDIAFALKGTLQIVRIAASFLMFILMTFKVSEYKFHGNIRA